MINFTHAKYDMLFASNLSRLAIFNYTSGSMLR